MKSEYIDLALADNTTGWKQGWFYLDNPAPTLKEKTGRVPVPGQSGPTRSQRETPKSSSLCWTT
jgi:hypothetical protein